MKNIEEQMSLYAAYHQDARNKATHFVGVPTIMLSLFIPLAWIRFEAGGVTVTAAMVFAAIVLAYYFILDVPLALAMLAITAFLVWLGDRIAGLGTMRAGSGSRCCSSAAGSCSSSATCSRAASRRSPTTCSRSSWRRSSWRRRFFSPWATNLNYTAESFS